MDLVAAGAHTDYQKVGTRQGCFLALLAKGAGKVGKVTPEGVDGDDYCYRRIIRRSGKHRQQAVLVASHAELVLQEPDGEEQAKVARRTRIVPGEAAHCRNSPPRNLEEDLLYLAIVQALAPRQGLQDSPQRIAISLLYLRQQVVAAGVACAMRVRR
ncbi:hypothetical protein FQZ97_886400 [compost metagenome]